MSKYEMLYRTIKEDILQGKYSYQQRLPSIREMENITGLSRTTIEAAYQQLLVEGYILSKNKIGYFVDVNLKEKQEMTSLKKNINQPVKIYYDYDFTGSSVDPTSFDMELWKKYIKMTLNKQNDLYEYGLQQGEYPLREALSRYSAMYRGVICHTEQMVIGSGFQSLLYILCGLLKDVKCIGMPQSGFLHAQMVFQDFNKEVVMLEEDDEGITINALKQAHVHLLYLNTSASGKKAGPLSISRRLEIIAYARENGMYIIEDDHNGELRYLAKPIPAMQSQDLKHIIYIGSFSKLLIPSIRMAYMILPEELLEKYNEKKSFYHQNTSKLEQLALAKYIEEGQLIRQLKKLRRLYEKKSTMMIKCINQYLNIESYILEETSLRVKVICQNEYSIEKLYENCHQSGIDILILNHQEFLLSFSSIRIDKIEAGIKKLKKALDSAYFSK